ncbi:MAG: hypothetical protein GQ569_02190 [Methylococcaceae bacterium]|nr:hypothetical protein [Methylococcaceae bacterium]
MKIKIFVEGIADQKFIADYIEYIFNIKLKIDTDIIQTKGWTTIASDSGRNFRLEMERNTNDGGINLVIFDSDLDFKKRQIEINEFKVKYKLEFELFLFPKNNEHEAGELEDLLEKIINPNNQAILDCWKRYEQCLLGIDDNRDDTLTIPAKKSRIYAYLETLVGNSRSEKDKIKDKNRNFQNTSHWNLNSEALQPLKNFLAGYLT